MSGCVRECAEGEREALRCPNSSALTRLPPPTAQSKDFGLIATDKGWTIFVGGNGGATPAHAKILANDVPPTMVFKIIDRYLM